MTQPRRRPVSVDTTADYYCVTQCVRRAFLCGLERFTGRSFEHRRDWIEGRLHELADITSQPPRLDVKARFPGPV